MSDERWYTESDVIKDLALASGRRISNIDNNFFVVGDDPPPPLLNEEDDELRLQLEASTANNGTFYDSYGIKPDLRGITEMLRLANESSHESTVNTDNVKVCTSIPEPTYDIISISKLNPNVKEFIPMTAVSQTDSGKDGATKIEDINKETSCIDKAKNVDNKQTSYVDNKVGCTDNKQAVCVDDLQRINAINQPVPMKDFGFVNSGNEIKKDVNLGLEDKLENDFMAHKNNFTKNGVANCKNHHPSNNMDSNKGTEVIATFLKNKISRISSSKTNTFHARKEKNVALLSLQKLYSLQPKQPEKKTVQLITPEYFEKAKAGDAFVSKNKENDKTANCNVLPPNTTLVVPEPNELTIEIEDSNSLKLPEAVESSSITYDEIKASPEEYCSRYLSNVSKIMTTTSDSGVQNVDSCVVKLNSSDPQIQKSIQKVNNWLNNDEQKPKGRAVYLNPVSFKKKQNVHRESPNEIAKKMAKPTINTIQQFVPSEYATELTEKYINRTKYRVIEKQNVTWSNLATKLKEKDEKMIKTMSQHSSVTNNTDVSLISDEGNSTASKLAEKDENIKINSKGSSLASSMEALSVHAQGSKTDAKMKVKYKVDTETKSLVSSFASSIKDISVRDQNSKITAKSSEKSEEIGVTKPENTGLASNISS